MAAQTGLRGSAALLLPIGLLYGMFALLPLLLILRLSFAQGLTQYRAVLASPLLLRVVGNTLSISLLTTLLSVALGFLLAVALWRAGPRLRTMLLAVILLPFWTAVLIKNFAWAALLQDNGAVDTLLISTGLIDHPLTLLHNRFAVIVGMVHYVLPYAVFPIYTALRGIDPRIPRAARSLGASTYSLAWRVVVPLALPGLTASALLSFIVAAGFYVTPVILGAPSDMMVSNLVDYYVHELVDFEKAAVLSVLILIALVPAIVLQQRAGRDGQHGSA